MKAEQQWCKAAVEEYQLSDIPEIRLLDTVSELGELSKELLKSSHYGGTPCLRTDSMFDEMGDCLFALLCLCNCLNIDAQDALKQSLNKYEARFSSSNDVSSGR